MNRKKVILSILMMVFLIAVGFVLPHLFKEKRGEKPASSAPTKEETTDTEQSSSKTALTFLDFSALQNFFSKVANVSYRYREHFDNFRSVLRRQNHLPKCF